MYTNDLPKRWNKSVTKRLQYDQKIEKSSKDGNETHKHENDTKTDSCKRRLSWSIETAARKRTPQTLLSVSDTLSYWQ